MLRSLRSVEDDEVNSSLIDRISSGLSTGELTLNHISGCYERRPRCRGCPCARAAATLGKHRNLELILVGDQDELTRLVDDIVGDNPRLRIQHASEIVAMSEPPAESIRKKKDSSMRVAINLVKEGAADACVSAGNTGALMATAKFVLKMLPGIDAPRDHR